MAISKNVGKIVNKALGVANKLSGPTAMASMVIFTFGVGAHNADIFQDPAGLETAANWMKAGAGLGVASIVAACSGGDIKNPRDLINQWKNNNPEKILQKAGRLYQKDPAKAHKYMSDRLETMSVQQRTAFSNYVTYSAKMSGFSNQQKTKDDLLRDKGREVFRQSILDVPVPQKKYTVGYDIK